MSIQANNIQYSNNKIQKCSLVIDSKVFQIQYEGGSYKVTQGDSTTSNEASSTTTSENTKEQSNNTSEQTNNTSEQTNNTSEQSNKQRQQSSKTTSQTTQNRRSNRINATKINNILNKSQERN
jgi:ribosome biogenesis protein BMS1